MSKFNEDELNAPSWLNKDFLEEVLRKSEKNDSVSVTDVKFSPATAQGDHYASVMFRAAVTYDSKKEKGLSKSLIVKTMPEVEGNKLDLVGDSFIFETEISMYENTIPKFEAELRKVGDNTVLGTRAFYSSLKPRKVIIFEDICPMGYNVIRDRLLTIEEVKAAISKLAKWHAVSYKLAGEGDISVTEYKESFLCFKDIEKMPFLTSGMDNFIAQIETMDEFKSYVPKLRTVQKDLVRRCIDSAKSFREKSPVGLHVLCHGDFHNKNMMFKHNSKGELDDVMLIDFQVCYFGPAILDLLYGMYIMIDADTRLNHFEELIHHYGTTFVETLKKLNFKGEIPSISDFFVELLRHRHYELLMLTTYLPLCYVVQEMELDAEQIMTSNDTRQKGYSNSKYLKELKRVFPMMINKGYLD